ncbi:MAG: hypothetical protein HW390_2070 [Candidatus Brocadiaceae bacterium]|nr:hypothetical protein [Candidatus Brocadiaceae bacterium]
MGMYFFKGLLNLTRNAARARLHTVAILLVLSVLLGSCGYSSKAVLRSNVRSIYVPVFDNKTFRRGYEFDLTKVDRDEADSILYGKITNVVEGVLIGDFTDNIVESRLTVFVDIRWVDTRTGRTIVERLNIARSAEFIVPRNETASTSGNEAFVGIAYGIIEAMGDEW